MASPLFFLDRIEGREICALQVLARDASSSAVHDARDATGEFSDQMAHSEEWHCQVTEKGLCSQCLFASEGLIQVQVKVGNDPLSAFAVRPRVMVTGSSEGDLTVTRICQIQRRAC